ncbi:MAG TPA: PP2C family protein-serine/threonine phosphatase [Anaerolineae bacterium]|nr:PP2C family protein-serine/threonine phosphatase [Anaerolineae bacterium]
MHLDVAVAKTRKYATPESGDTIEMIERPGGGLSFVVVDGQRSGKSAKAISNIVARKAVTLLAEGIRDGAAARASHDYLYTHRSGKVSATLNIVSVDLESRTLVLSRNNHCPTIVSLNGELKIFDEPSQPVGVQRGTKPIIHELPLTPETTVVIFTDGLTSAGERKGRPLNVPELVRELIGRQLTAEAFAQTLLTEALSADDQRPADDISILVLTISAREQSDDTRWLKVSMPL